MYSLLVLLVGVWSSFLPNSSFLFDGHPSGDAEARGHIPHGVLHVLEFLLLLLGDDSSLHLHLQALTNSPVVEEVVGLRMAKDGLCIPNYRE